MNYKFRDTEPIFFFKRDGTELDPYLDIIENIRVEDNRIFLKESPDKFEKVRIENGSILYSEVDHIDKVSSSPLSYFVDYREGVVYFNGMANNKDMKITYKGIGVLLYPASRIYLNNNLGSGVVETLQDLVDDARDATDGVEEALGKINTAIDNANQSGQYAKEQGDYAKLEASNLSGLKQDVIDATNNANQVSAEAQEKIDEFNANEEIRKANEIVRESNEVIRESNEANRQTNTDNAIKRLDDSIEHLVAKDEYDPSIQYYAKNVVKFSGNGYMCIADAIGIDPTNTSHWKMIVEKGEQGDQGIQGEKGEKGDQGIQGAKGDKGDTGEGFQITKTYSSVEAMNNDFDNPDIKIGDFVLINTDNVEEEDNARLYVKGETQFSYLTDLSGAQGIKGERGEKGDKPTHYWEGTSLRFENPDGTLGEAINLKGEKGDRGLDGTGSVVSVNSVRPELDGNVILSPEDIGASPKDHTHAELHTHTNKDVLDKLTDDNGKLTYNGQSVGSVVSVNGQTGEVVITSTEVGLGNVDNTSDLDKPISTATQTALDDKISKSEKGVAGGVALLNEDGKVVDKDGNLVEGRVSSVNGKTGDVKIGEIIQQDTPPDGIEEGRLWLDTSETAYQGTDFLELENKIITVDGKIANVDNRITEVDGKAVKSINGNLPDEQGNVAIEVGAGSVKSVNSLLPDVDGNVTLTSKEILHITEMTPAKKSTLYPYGISVFNVVDTFEDWKNEILSKTGYTIDGNYTIHIITHRSLGYGHATTRNVYQEVYVYDSAQAQNYLKFNRRMADNALASWRWYKETSVTDVKNETLFLESPMSVQAGKNMYTEIESVNNSVLEHTDDTGKHLQTGEREKINNSLQKGVYNDTNISNLGMYTVSKNIYFYDWDADNSKLDSMYINIPAKNYSGFIKLTLTSTYSVGNAMGGAEVIYHVGKVGTTSYMNQREITAISSTFANGFFIGSPNYQEERLFIPITKAPNTKNPLNIKIDLISAETDIFTMANNITVARDAVISQPHPWTPQTSNYVSKTDRLVRIGDWGTLSDNPSGKFYIASNAYLSNNDLKYSNTHASFGARGLIFDWGAGMLNTLKYFDTGSKATTQNETFVTAEFNVYHSGNAPFKVGSGNPEGVITANMGTIFLNQYGGAGTTLYVKQSGTGNTGWVAK